MIKKFFDCLWQEAMRVNQQNILSLVERNPGAVFGDLGCDDGHWTVKVAEAIGTKKMYGLDLFGPVLRKAAALEIRVKKTDLNQKLPFPDGFFTVIQTNQVIEHLIDPDYFLEELFRIIKPGGYVVLSTENLSAWFNLFALMMGWSAFSQHASSRCLLGNPLALHAGEKMRPGWQHLKVFTLYSLCRLMEAYGFQIETVRGAGYYPFFGFFGLWAARIDPTHAHFITLKARKPR